MHVDVGIVIHWSMTWCNACSEPVGVIQHHIDRLAAAHIANAVSGVLVAGWSERSSGQCRGRQVAVAFLRHSEGFWLARRPGRHTVHVRGGSCRGYWGLCTQSHASTPVHVNNCLVREPGLPSCQRELPFSLLQTCSHNQDIRRISYFCSGWQCFPPTSLCMILFHR